MKADPGIERNPWLRRTDRVLVVGAGGLGRGVAAWLRHVIEEANESAIEIAFLDDNPKALASFETSLQVSSSCELYEPRVGDAVLVAIGNPRPRAHVASRLIERGANLVSLIHPTAVLGDRVAIGRGCLICPNTVIDSDASLGEFVVVNLMSSVGHDAVLQDFVSLSCHVDLCGGVQLGRAAFLGSHASVLPGVCVGEEAVIGAGAVVHRDALAGQTFAGVPAKRLSSRKAA